MLTKLETKGRPFMNPAKGHVWDLIRDQVGHQVDAKVRYLVLDPILIKLRREIRNVN